MECTGSSMPDNNDLFTTKTTSKGEAAKTLMVFLNEELKQDFPAAELCTPQVYEELFGINKAFQPAWLIIGAYSGWSAAWHAVKPELVAHWEATQQLFEFEVAVQEYGKQALSKFDQPRQSQQMSLKFT
jgi:hypothetical protein